MVRSRRNSSEQTTDKASDNEPGQKSPAPTEDQSDAKEGEDVILTDKQKEAVDLNKHYQDKLKWDLGDIVEHLPKSKTISGLGLKFLKAVKKFQRANGLSVDGIVGPKTYDLILKKKRTPFEEAMFDIAEPTIMKESSGDYSAMNKNGEYRGLFGEDHRAYQKVMIGLSFGAYQFTQDSGSLGKLLKRLCKRDREAFVSIVGPTWSRLLEITNRDGESGFSTGVLRGPRVMPIPVDYQGRRVERDLWEEPWTDKMRRLGQVPEFQIEQHKLAVSMYMEPMMQFLNNYGFYSEKMVGAAFSSSIHRGSYGAMEFINGRVDDVGEGEEAVLTEMARVDDRYDFFVSTDDLRWDRWDGWDFWTGETFRGT